MLPSKDNHKVLPVNIYKTIQFHCKFCTSASRNVTAAIAFYIRFYVSKNMQLNIIAVT